MYHCRRCNIDHTEVLIIPGKYAGSNRPLVICPKCMHIIREEHYAEHRNCNAPMRNQS